MLYASRGSAFHPSVTQHEPQHPALGFCHFRESASWYLTISRHDATRDATGNAAANGGSAATHYLPTIYHDGDRCTSCGPRVAFLPTRDRAARTRTSQLNVL